ncbi:MAG: hypothetical protein CME66_01690 [Halobacteriovoraceae bacterium]|jgi:glycosyltransferase involved in cell wall biosynthesis|nr:hypothetical protein [Halobacteriovoraceae bacterium]
MKAALVYSFQESEWFSCTVITKNIIAAYARALGRENIIHLNYSEKDGVSKNDLLRLETEKVDKVIFIDHKPTPCRFLEKLNLTQSKALEQLEFIIHIFGDFPLYLPEWRVVNNLLIDKKVKIICASERQRKLIQKVFVPKESIFVAPFPVDKDHFYFSQKKRQELRKKYSILPETPVFLYSGRLSLQKRLVESITCFLEAIQNKVIPAQSVFYIIGAEDKLGIPYLAYSQLHGEYFRMLDRVLKKYPKKLSQQVKLLGKVEHSELADFYNLSDVFFSLSTYHDEDYGMAVAEALCCGMRCILSDWAGYASFGSEEYLKEFSYISVKLGASSPQLNLEEVEKGMKNLLSLHGDREKMAHSMQKRLSVEAVAVIYAKILQNQSSHFGQRTSLMSRLINEQMIKEKEIFRSETNREFNNLYYEFYEAYVR